MTRLVTLSFLWLLVGAPPCHAEIIQTNDASVIQTALENADSQTLAIFDVDDVLLIPSDQILTTPHRPFLAELQQSLERRVGAAKAQELYSLIMAQRQNGTVDQALVALMTTLQDKGVRVLALTNCATGSFGIIPSLEKWRLTELLRHGYDFERSWRGVGPKTFEGLAKEKNGFSSSPRPPRFEGGVVFTSDVPKGLVVTAFLKDLSPAPQKIIFIDDKRSHLESAEAAVEPLGISFLGIHYTKAHEKSQGPLNQERARYQFKILEQEKRWPSDLKADKERLLNP